MSTNTAVLPTRWDLSSLANSSLTSAATFWFAVTLLGQWIFTFYIAVNYGFPAARGNFSAWNQTLAQGYAPHNTMGNSTLVIHLFFAAFISLSGALQILPGFRARFPVFHRWNGRIYMLAALLMSFSGLYLTWSGRRVVGDFFQKMGVSLNAILILVCGTFALYYAIHRDFSAHRRWALRLFLVMSGVWFFRVGLMLSFLIFKGPFGFDPQTFTGPFLTALTFGQYLVSLGVLELYFYARRNPGLLARFAVASLLFVLTLAMGAGIFGATAGLWTPRIKVAFDSRTSVANLFSNIVSANGLDAAVKQYYELKAAHPPNYNFDETELHNLGYQYLHASQIKESVRVFQLNVEAFPDSSNAYDDLGEAFMDDGNKPLAILNYQKSLDLNPKNGNAVKMLQKLRAN